MNADNDPFSLEPSAPPRLRGLFMVFASLLGLSLLKYFWLALYAHPVADDFCYAAKSQGMSLWDWSYSEWMYWNGRYASNLLMIHGPLSWSPDFLPGYRMVPMGLIVLTFLSFWFFFRSLTQRAFTIGQELLATTVFLLLYLNLMPDLGEGFYWYTGAVTYQLGSILLLLHLGLLIGMPSKGLGLVLKTLLNLILAVAIVGMDEIHMLLMVGLHLGLTLWAIRERKSQLSALLLLIVVTGGALLMYLAPGNDVRGAMFADTHLFWKSLGMSFLQAIRFIGIWVFAPALLIFSLLYISIYHRLRATIPAITRVLSISPWIAGALPFLLVMAVTFPAYWSSGLLGQHRTINVACLFFIPLWFVNLTLWIERGTLRNIAPKSITPKVMGIAMVLAIVALNLTRNGFAANSDLLTGRAAQYDHVMLQREAEVRAVAADPNATVTFIRLADPPRTLSTYEVQGPLRDWMMNCEVRFFGGEDGQVIMKGEE
ncbi:MAG: DUF6056 family protein [Flavobacteriales bacterium]